MGLLSRQLAGIRVLALCLGSWGLLGYGVNAQNEVIGVADVADRSNAMALVKGAKTSHQLDISAQLIPASAHSDSLGKEDAESSTQWDCASPLLASSSVLCRYWSRYLDESLQVLADNHGDGSLSEEADDNEPLESEHEQQTDDDSDDSDVIDDELGILRLRSQPIGIDSELGVLRIRPTEDVPLEVEPEPTRQTTVFLTGRGNIYGGNNLFRTPDPIDDRIYQTGIGIFAFPRISDTTNLVLSAEANLARYEDLSVVDYNELQFQAGIRQRLGQRSYGQINWRYQNLSTPGSDSFFTADYIELLLSRRDILNNRTWLDTYYQARLSYSDPEEFSRFSQIATGSLNYGFDPQTRVSLLYQLFLDDYTETARHDTYHQVLAQFSHDLSSTTRVSLFTGFRFGRSSRSNVNFDDTIYGVSINITLPLF
ncbi:hypothetical protein N836_07870 [Leptolyngbya sp. Heron Island J]|nr:hypothetical protein N836_07870 [Leptolyngbya sp. Heron Island J]